MGFWSSVVEFVSPVSVVSGALNGGIANPWDFASAAYAKMTVEPTMAAPTTSSLSPWDLNCDGLMDALDTDKILTMLGIDTEKELTEEDVEKYEKFVSKINALNVGSDYLSTLDGNTLEQFISAYGARGEMSKDSLLGILNDNNAALGAKKIAVALLNDFDDLNTTTTMQASLSADEIRGSALARAGGIPGSTKPKIASATTAKELISLINQAAGLRNQNYLTTASLTLAIDSGLLSEGDQEKAETILDNFADLDNGNGNLFSREMDSLKLF